MEIPFGFGRLEEAHGVVDQPEHFILELSCWDWHVLSPAPTICFFNHAVNAPRNEGGSKIPSEKNMGLAPV